MEAKKKCVVIVDDDRDLLELLSFGFRKKGFVIKKFCHGADALTFLFDKNNAEALSLLILDRILPDMDGLSILQHCASDPFLKMPIVILSSLSAEKDMLAGLREGAIDYITKPFNLSVFMEKALALIAHGPKGSSL